MANSQNGNGNAAVSCYWVMLTDKSGSTFDPYSYFDSKAIERYRINNADLYDISNYPLNDSYVQQIESILIQNSKFKIQNSQLIGTSRWFNAAAVRATPEQIEEIVRLPFVKEVVAIESNMHLAQHVEYGNTTMQQFDKATTQKLHDQLVRMGGKYFRDKNIDGKGVRIAVFDGGFPQVNTHAAFKHLRENHQIVKTWNFPNKKEDVYGWNSHGLMTLSCIAARQGDMDLGMATGAEFLLARTEVEAEPFKEEVWWQMAVEWADKNGAQIISSSLGYGKDRYYTKDMNGQSYVAKAANMAARKGILVCNSAGNEGDDDTWYTIITPSDADSVLCVGGIIPSLTDYDRTSFSSYGPSADGRQKPNVTAFAYAWTANTGKDNDDFHLVPGTSFSCPLVAGFAACAMQSRPGIKAMELFHEIEKSADLYPYCDYTYGYGVPQADYFTGDRKKVEPTFRFEKNDNILNLIPLKDFDKCRIFIKNSTENGAITQYEKNEFEQLGKDDTLQFSEGDIITVNLEGYTDSYNFNTHDVPSPSESVGEMDWMFAGETDLVSSQTAHHFTARLNEKKTRAEWFYTLGVPINIADELDHVFWSPSWSIGVRWTRYFAKAYGWGLGVEYGNSSYRFGDVASNALENMIAMNTLVDGASKISKRQVNLNRFSVELYQRVRFVPLGMLHKGLYWDLGGYVSFANNNYRLKYSDDADFIADKRDIRLHNVNPLRGERLQYGVTTRLIYDCVGLYGRFNLHRLGKDLAPDEVALPALEVGLQLAF